MTTIGSLFSGIAGLDRGLESVGLGPVLWQAESDDACRRVLRRHYPKARLYEDVRDVDERTERVSVVCGGSPCQDISNAGRRDGIGGERSGLWSEFARIVSDLRPDVVFFENVAAITSAAGRAYCVCSCQRRQAPFVYGTVCQFCGRPMGAAADQPPDETALGTVLGDLAALGYDAVWTSVRASDVGAPHRRERLFILAYSDRERVRELHRRSSGARGTCQAQLADDGEAVADSASIGWDEGQWRIGQAGGRPVAGDDGQDMRSSVLMPDGEQRMPGAQRGPIGVAGLPDPRESVRCTSAQEDGVAHADGPGREQLGGGRLLDGERPPQRDDVDRCDCPRCYIHRFPPGPDRIAEWDGAQPAVRRGDARCTGRIHRGDALRMLGNAVVAQQAALAWDILVAQILR